MCINLEIANNLEKMLLYLIPVLRFIAKIFNKENKQAIKKCEQHFSSVIESHDVSILNAMNYSTKLKLDESLDNDINKKINQITNKIKQNLTMNTMQITIFL